MSRHKRYMQTPEHLSAANQSLTGPLTTPLTDTPRRRAILKQLRSHPSVKGSVIALLLLMAVVLLAPFFAPQNP